MCHSTVLRSGSARGKRRRASSAVMREDVMLGQAWLITPAPLEDLRKAELEWARLLELLEQLRAGGAPNG